MIAKIFALCLPLGVLMLVILKLQGHIPDVSFVWLVAPLFVPTVVRLFFFALVSLVAVFAIRKGAKGG